MALKHFLDLIGRDRTGPAFSSAQSRISKLNRSFDNFGRTLGVVAGATGIGLATKSVFDLGIKFESLKVQMASATGSVQAGEQAFAFARKTADEFGLSLVGTAEQFAKLSAAAKDTELQGQATQEIFTSVSQAARVLNLSADDTAGAFRAIQQVISKGTLQAEEIRGQFGERIPGAFQIASRAMGVTTAELGKMLEQGEVVATDFLPKFAKELDKTFGAQAEAAKNSPAAKIQRLKNQIVDLQVAIGNSGLIDFLANAATKATTLAKNFGLFYHTITGQDYADVEGLNVQLVIAQDKLHELKKAADESYNSLERFGIVRPPDYKNEAAIEALRKQQEEVDRLEKKIARLKTPTEAPAGAGGSSKPVNPFGLTDDALKKEFETVQKYLLDQEEAVAASYARRREIVRGHQAVTASFTKEMGDALISELDAKEQEELKKLEEREAIKLQRLTDSFLKRGELSILEIDRKKELAEKEITDKVALDEILVNLEEEKQKRILDAIKKGEASKAQIEQLSAKTRFQSAAGSLGAIFGAFGQHSKKMFKLQKVAAIAEGAVAIQGGVLKALNNPYPQNLAFAASVAATGAGMLSNLKSLSGGGSISAGSGGGGSYGGSGISAGGPTSPAYPDLTAPSEQPRTTTIIIEGDDDQFLSVRRVRELIEKINEQQRDGAVIQAA